MRLQELFEGKLKNLAIDREFDGPLFRSTLPAITYNYRLSINGKLWGQFKTEQQAIAAGNKIRLTKPYLRIDVVSI